MFNPLGASGSQHCGRPTGSGQVGQDRLCGPGGPGSALDGSSAKSQLETRQIRSVSLASGGQQTDRRAARSGLIGLVDLAGLAATLTGALPSHNLKPENMFNQTGASGGQ